MSCEEKGLSTSSSVGLVLFREYSEQASIIDIIRKKERIIVTGGVEH
jgi:hypothetical protein